MATPRPTFIDLEAPRSDSAATRRSPLTSPRIQHFDGDVPPALSPLDAFAAHSRRLARELEETRKAGERRLSRLPPQHISRSYDEFQKSRPSIFRQLSNENDAVPPLPPQFRNDSGLQVTDPKTRPVSSYPQVGGAEQVVDNEPRLAKSYFEAPRSESPSQLERTIGNIQNDKSIQREPSSASNPGLTFTLAPPNAAFAKKPYHESSDDDYTSSNAGSTFSSQQRRVSSSSGVSIPQSPISPFIRHHEKSPSQDSNHSLSSKRRSHLNFSRPMSSSSLNQLDQLSPSRYNSVTSQESRISTVLPGLPTPSNSFDDARSVQSDGFIDQQQSYTHTTWTLPRGRTSNRASQLFLGLSTPTFRWQEPMFPGTPPLEARPSQEQPLPSPVTLGRPSKDSSKREDFFFDFDRPRLLKPENRPSSASDSTPSTVRVATTNDIRPSTAQPQPSTSYFPPMPPVPPEPVDNSRSSRSNSTIRPTTARSDSNYQALTADEHVTKAIDMHQHGDLKESTYHLRIAAKQNHPTGMLLYALACRHGWGMRPNQTEGVRWLRKAVDLAQLEVADDEDPNTTLPRDQGEKKAHRAQFALSIYELGQCHLNGWGMEVDKALALRCFEIAGTWGDTDALTEAGFCYAQGIGCKKDLKKAAKWYRLAESKGVSMIGNSWIHKPKYDDVPADDRKARSDRKTSGEHKRNKSKTRSMWPRKKA